MSRKRCGNTIKAEGSKAVWFKFVFGMGRLFDVRMVAQTKMLVGLSGNPRSPIIEDRSFYRAPAG